MGAIFLVTPCHASVSQHLQEDSVAYICLFVVDARVPPKAFWAIGSHNFLILPTSINLVCLLLNMKCLCDCHDQWYRVNVMLCQFLVPRPRQASFIFCLLEH